MSYPGSILGWSGPSIAKTPTQLAAEAKAGAAAAQPMIAERRERAAERAESGLLPGVLGGIQMAGQQTVRGGQEVLGGAVKGVAGIDLSPAAIKEQSLIEQAQQAQSDLFGGAIGGIGKAFGVEPKTLLILGAAAAIGIVVLLVVLKT